MEGSKLYKKYAGVLPVGGGLRYCFKRSLMIYGELTYHQTTTDYIDDVSGFYYDYGELTKARGEIAGALSYRGTRDEYPDYLGRGNPDSNDGYITLSIGISKQLGRSNNASVPEYENLYRDNNKF